MSSERHPEMDPARFRAWADAMGPVVDSPSPSEIAMLLRVWESGTMWDRVDGDGYECTHPHRLTPSQRAEARELARQAVVAAGGRYTTTASVGPFKSADLVVVAEDE